MAHLLLDHIPVQQRPARKAGMGKGFPRLSANLAQPPVLSGATAPEEDGQGPQDEGLFLRSP